MQVRIGSQPHLGDAIAQAAQGASAGRLAVQRAERLSRTADVAGCLSLEALHGTTLAFDELASGPPLVRFASLTLVTAGELRLRGLRLEATGRGLGPEPALVHAPVVVPAQRGELVDVGLATVAQIELDRHAAAAQQVG